MQLAIHKLLPLLQQISKIALHTAMEIFCILSCLYSGFFLNKKSYVSIIHAMVKILGILSHITIATWDVFTVYCVLVARTIIIALLICFIEYSFIMFMWFFMWYFVWYFMIFYVLCDRVAESCLKSCVSRACVLLRGVDETRDHDVFYLLFFWPPPRVSIQGDRLTFWNATYPTNLIQAAPSLELTGKPLASAFNHAGNFLYYVSDEDNMVHSIDFTDVNDVIPKGTMESSCMLKYSSHHFLLPYKIKYEETYNKIKIHNSLPFPLLPLSSQYITIKYFYVHKCEFHEIKIYLLCDHITFC